MTQVTVTTLLTLSWPHTDPDSGTTQHLRGLGPSGTTLQIPEATFAANSLALGHIDHLPLHQQRVIAEHAVNQDRLAKLNAFFDTDLYRGLDEEEQQDLAHQAQVMADLGTILTSRIERFTKVREAQLAALTAK